MSRTRRWPRLAAPILLVVLATPVIAAFVLGARDGLAWRAASDAALVAPDLWVADPARARRVPDFALTDRHGNVLRLSGFAAADLLIVNIWSSSCPACAEELPALIELDRRLPRLGRVALLTITTDARWSDVAGFFPRGTDLRVLFDPGEAVTKGVFGTTRYPETFVLDRERRIRARFDGKRDWPADPLLDFFRRLL